MASVFKRAIWRFVNFPAPEWVKVTGVVGGLCGLAVYLVAGRKSKKAGEGLFDSEKPESLRNEKERNIEEERAALEKAKLVDTSSRH